MKNKIKNSNLFDTTSFIEEEIFTDVEYPWEVIEKLSSYVKTRVGEKNKIVDKSSTLDPSVKIDGKVIVGKESKISDSVLIRGSCIIGDNVHIGHGVEVKNSIILNNSAIAHLNYVGDSIVGNNVNVGGGLIFANWRFDKSNIKIKAEKEKIDTGLEKFGAAVGDNSNLGVNAVLNPGVILGKNCIVFPLKSVVGCHSENSVIK